MNNNTFAATLAFGLIISTTNGAVILNSGFEDPTHTRNDGTDPNNWTVIETANGTNPDRQVRTKDEFKRSGSMGLQLGAGQSNHDGQLWQPLTTVASQQYTFSIWAMVTNENLDASLQNFTVYLRDGSGTGGSVLGTLASSGDLTETWKEYTIDFTASSTTTTIHILDSATAVAADSNDMVLDDLSITVIPEPSSLTLFGLVGSVVMLRRRRK